MGPVVSDVAISEISESPPKNAVEDNQCTNFPPHWWSICESVRDNLPEGYQIGPLHKNDYDHGFLECLSQLTVVGRVSQQLFEGK